MITDTLTIRDVGGKLGMDGAVWTVTIHEDGTTLPVGAVEMLPQHPGWVSQRAALGYIKRRAQQQGHTDEMAIVRTKMCDGTFKWFVWAC